MLRIGSKGSELRSFSFTEGPPARKTAEETKRRPLRPSIRVRAGGGSKDDSDAEKRSQDPPLGFSRLMKGVVQ